MTHVFSPSGAKDDSRCRRTTYWRRVHGQRGIEPVGLDLDLLFGKVMHAASAGLVQGHDPIGIVATAVDEISQAIEAGRWPQLTQEEIDHMHLELANLAAGIVWAFNRRIVPRMLEEYEILSVEQERVKWFRPGFGLRATTDVLLRAKDGSLPGIGYREYKTTSSTSGSWFKQWMRNPQAWAGAVVTPEEIFGEPVQWFEVLGLYKGQVRDGVRSSPFCYGYRLACPEEPHPSEMKPTEFWRDGILYDTESRRQKGWEKFPAHAFPGGVRGWVDAMSEETLDTQFPITPPVLIDEELLQTWLRQQLLREEEIAQAKSLLFEGVAGQPIAPEHEQLVLDTVFKQSFDQCDPAIGKACPFGECCHNPVVGADPVGSGKYLWRELRPVQGQAAQTEEAA